VNSLIKIDRAQCAMRIVRLTNCLQMTHANVVALYAADIVNNDRWLYPDCTSYKHVTQNCELLHEYWLLPLQHAKRECFEVNYRQVYYSTHE